MDSVFMPDFIIYAFCVVSIVLGIFSIYVILTKSKVLGSFKYYLINQLIWSQLFEVAVVFLKPMSISPYLGSYFGGILRHLSYETTLVSVAIWGILFINVQMSTVLSLVNRYVFVFRPEYRPYLENKRSIFLIAMSHILMYIFVVWLLYATSETADIIRQKAHNDTNGALDVYFEQSTFIYLGPSKLASKCFLFIDMFIMIGLLLCITYFVVNVFVHKKKSATISKTAASLLLSSLVQTFLFIVFLIMPIHYALAMTAFEVQDSAFMCNVILSLSNVHSTADVICMLCCIVPYRNYCRTLFKSAVQTVKSGSNVWNTAYLFKGASVQPSNY
uniref:Serpentine Receptor, class T n=1 Tax=Panagrellus redivivus TaxID=6233 RepID=A0A7E4WBP9_PANRE